MSKIRRVADKVALFFFGRALGVVIFDFSIKSENFVLKICALAARNMYEVLLLLDKSENDGGGREQHWRDLCCHIC